MQTKYTTPPRAIPTGIRPIHAPVVSASVIICAYTEQRWNDLIEAVESMKRQSVLPLEIIVVIDHNPALFERVLSGIPDVTVLENCQERGLSGARNTGIAQARGDIVAFMDEDAVAEPDWLELLNKAYSSPQVLGVGGSIDPIWLTKKPGWFPAEFNWVVGCTYLGMPKQTAPVRNLIGANMSFRREIFDRSGGFIHGMGRIGTRPLGCEETEFCIRASNDTSSGYFLFEPRARVHHRVPAARSGWRYFLSRCYSEGLSKAQVSRFVGSRKGLANERTYTFKTLPRGVMVGLKDVFTKGDILGLGRAAAITIGLITTTIGYLSGKIARQSQ